MKGGFMTHAPTHLAALSRLFANRNGGIAGLVDNLLKLCVERDLQLDWHADHCRVRCAGGQWEEAEIVPFRRPLFRDMLARLAVLGNERIPNSVSLYGGTGEVAVAANPLAVLRIKIINKSDEQCLELVTMESSTNLDRETKMLSGAD
jgi:hypothetical protein